MAGAGVAIFSLGIAMGFAQDWPQTKASGTSPFINDSRVGMATIAIPSSLVFSGPDGSSITIKPDGTVVLSNGLALDDGARAFWGAVQKIGMKLACPDKP